MRIGRKAEAGLKGLPPLAVAAALAALMAACYDPADPLTRTAPAVPAVPAAPAVPIELISTTQGEIAVVGERDYYRIVVPHSGMVAIETFGDTDTFGVVHDVSSRTLTVPFNYGEAPRIEDDNSGELQNFRISRRFPRGEYIIEVRHVSRLEAGPYELKVYFKEDPPPTITTLTPTMLTATATIKLPYENGIRYHRIVVPEEGILRTEASGSHSSGIDAALFDSAGNMLRYSYLKEEIITREQFERGARAKRYSFQISTPVKPGEYMLELRPYPRNLNSNAEFSTSHPINIELVPGPVSSVALTPGSQLMVPGDDSEDDFSIHHYYRVDLDQSGVLAIKVDPDGVEHAYSRPHLENILFAERDGQFLQLRESSRRYYVREDREYEIRSWVPAGTYYVRTDHPVALSKPYQISVEFDPSIQPVKLESGKTISGRLNRSGDADYYRIEVDRYGYLAAESFGSIETYGVLLDEHGAELGDGGRTGGNGFLINAPITPGIYYVEVRSNPNTRPGRYEFSSNIEDVRLEIVQCSRGCSG